MKDVLSIPVFNEIAAGNPIFMNDSIEDNYYLPKEWIRKTKDVFILKVKGDSMINKNIYDGDYVVIMPENTKYEPIIIEDQKFSFLGVAIGFIKNSQN